MTSLLRSTIGGRYALCGEIASGGMATVHLARQVGAAGFARIVAIKRLHERYARDPDFVAMFLDEARIVARIRHPNVVQTIDVVAEDGELFLVMEYIHGESLLRMLQVGHRRGTVLPVPVVAAIVAGALHGLHEAHEARSETGDPLGIVHRDVSPHNILIGTDGAVRVLDFGVAKASQRIQTTREGQLKGKLSYMAPEQITNRPTDRRTDVYATAVVLWEALAGAKLFHGESEAAVLNQILLEEPRSPSTKTRQVPAALEAIVLRGLSREPYERFASAREMALAIESATALASPTEIGAMVASLCETTVSARAELIASIELKSSSSNLREAVDSLRFLASASGRSAAPSGTPGAVKLPPPGAISSPAAAATFPPAPLWAIAASTGLVAAALVAAGYMVVAKRTMAGTKTAASSLSAGEGAGEGASAGAGASAGVGTEAGAGCSEGMVVVNGGRFFMGSDDDLPAERPSHKVTLRAYCMDKLEITTDAYRACSDRGDCKRAGTTNKWTGMTTKESRAYDPLCNSASSAADAARGKHPANCVDWSMADRYCKAEGKRLPTEAEWEFAARGSDGRRYPWGDQPPSSKLLNACGSECVAWGKKHGAALEAMFGEADPFATTAPVGSFPLGASRWGIEDMVGNVWEWVADYYAPYQAADQEDPAGPASGETRAMRGGAWNGAYPDWVRPTFRFHDAADTRSHGVGFRCAKTL